MKRQISRILEPEQFPEEDKPKIHVDYNGQTWLQQKSITLPEYIRLKARNCIKEHEGKHYRLILCGTGVFGHKKLWYYADDPEKKVIVRIECSLFPGIFRIDNGPTGAD
jgi:hypothetical protein